MYITQDNIATGYIPHEIRFPVIYHVSKKSRINRKQLTQKIAFGIFRLLTYGVIGILFFITGFIIYNGIGVINWDFLTQAPQEGMTKGGIFPAIAGTFYLVIGSAIFSFPIGIMSGIYINEYASNGRMVQFIRVMTNSLNSVPSIVFGLFGMSLFVNTLGFGDSILAGSLTLGLLILPVVIRTTEEALKAIDDTYRHGSLALGASKWQTIRKVILPSAFPGILTGLTLSIGRVSGETAPILFTVAAYFLPQLPHSIFDQVMALPYHLYVLVTSGTDIAASRSAAYGSAVVLIFIVFMINIISTLIKSKVKSKK